MYKLSAVLLLLAASASAQQLIDAPEPHKFFTKTNTALILGSASLYAADGYTTQWVLQSPIYGEANPVARAFGNSRKGTAMFQATSFGATVSGMYLAHRLHHHRLEKIIPLITMGIETGFVIHNARLHIPSLGDLGKGPIRGPGIHLP